MVSEASHPAELEVYISRLEAADDPAAVYASWQGTDAITPEDLLAEYEQVVAARQG